MALAFFDFRPKLAEIATGYDRCRFVADLGAGLTVAAVALPLAMAFAIASGLKPEAGLITAVIAGFLISALGGSRVQIGGPAGAFIVIVYDILARYGLANLIIATALSGVLLFLMGFFKLGSLIRFVPVAVVIGFTNGIAVLIAVSQVRDFLGLATGPMPASFFGILSVLANTLASFNWQAVWLAVLSLVLIVWWQFRLPAVARAARWARRLPLVPGSVVALLLSTLAVVVFNMDVDTIGSRFGGIPSTLPGFHFPEFSWETARFLLIPTLTLAFLGAIESLLCARVADGMIGDRHNPNQELMAQGIANFITPFFGGMPATGTIARTVTNVKSGATSPVAGMVHALTLLLVMLLAAPMARYVPMAVLSAILLFVAWNMGQWRAFAQLRHFRLPYRITLLAVFLLTVVFDLTVAVEVGLVAACVTFIYRISSLSRSETVGAQDQPLLQGQEGRIAVFRLYGAIFFGAVKLVEQLEREMPREVLVVDLKNVIYVDSSGADSLIELVRICRQNRVRLLLCGLNHQPLDIAKRTGLLNLVPEADLCPDLASGIAVAAGAG